MAVVVPRRRIGEAVLLSPGDASTYTPSPYAAPAAPYTPTSTPAPAAAPDAPAAPLVVTIEPMTLVSTAIPLPTPPLEKPEPASGTSSSSSGMQIGGAVLLATGVALGIGALVAARRKKKSGARTALMVGSAVAVVVGGTALIVGSRFDV